jgi:hypothetical protein
VARNTWCLHSLRTHALVVNLMIGLMSNNLQKIGCYRRFSYQGKVTTTRNGESTEEATEPSHYQGASVEAELVT